MRVMADGTILLHGLMIADKGPTFLHVAGIAGIVDVISDHHAGTCGAMRVMTVGAGDLAFPYGVAVRAINLASLLFMTGKTHFRLGQPVAHLIVSGMHLVASGTGCILVCVAAASPVHALAALVTSKTSLVLFL